jgi:hypothetical protein
LWILLKVSPLFRSSKLQEKPLVLQRTSCFLHKYLNPILIQTIRNFFSSRAAEWVDVWNIVPSEISAKTVNCFTENTEDMVVKCLKKDRNGKKPVAGPYAEPETSYETLHGSLYVNPQVYPKYNQ